MTATKGLGTYGNAVGTVTPLDHKMAHLGLIAKTAANTIRPGLFWDGSATVVSGKANMSYDVRALSAVLSRGSTAGAVLLTNDAVYNVATTAAPGSNSRYDVVYLWQREYSLDGTDSNPVIGVEQGTAATVPSVPSLAAYPGAIELARILVPSGVTATNSGTTITQTAPFTATQGGVIPFRNTTERDAGTYVESQLGWLIDTDIYQVYSGAAWQTIVRSQPGLISIIPTSAVNGTVGSGGKVTFTTASSVSLNGCFTSSYDNYRVVISDLTQSTSATIQMRVRGSGSDESSSVYDRSSSTNGAGSLASGTSLAQSSWELGSVGAQAEWDLRLEVAGPALSAKTRVRCEVDAIITATNAQWFNIEKLTHRTASGYDGFTIYPSSGTITGTIRVYGYNNN